MSFDADAQLAIDNLKAALAVNSPQSLYSRTDLIQMIAWLSLAIGGTGGGGAGGDASAANQLAQQAVLGDILAELRDDRQLIESVWFDKLSPTLFYLRRITINQDTGAEVVSFRNVDNTPATPGVANLVQAVSAVDFEPVTITYIAAIAGTGYALKDCIQELQLVTSTGSIATTIWFNRTQNTVLATAPVFAHLQKDTVLDDLLVEAKKNFQLSEIIFQHKDTGEFLIRRLQKNATTGSISVAWTDLANNIVAPTITDYNICNDRIPSTITELGYAGGQAYFRRTTSFYNVATALVDTVAVSFVDKNGTISTQPPGFSLVNPAYDLLGKPSAQSSKVITLKNYVFSASGKNIYLPSFYCDLNKIKLVRDVTNGQVIFDITDPAKIGTLNLQVSGSGPTGSTLALLFDTSVAGFDDADTLEILAELTYDNQGWMVAPAQGDLTFGYDPGSNSTHPISVTSNGSLNVNIQGGGGGTRDVDITNGSATVVGAVGGAPCEGHNTIIFDVSGTWVGVVKAALYIGGDITYVDRILNLTNGSSTVVSEITANGRYAFDCCGAEVAGLRIVAITSGEVFGKGRCSTSKLTWPLVIRSDANSSSLLITAGGVAQTALAANLSRNGFEIQNNSAGDLVFSIGSTATLTNGFKLPSGAGYSSPAAMISTAAISLIGATTGQQFTIIEY